jgi:RNA polymerase sigma-70 factor (ECF subfamily)
MPRADDKLQSDRRWLRRHARRVARSPGSVDDLVQETYLTALSRPPPEGPMRPWLLGVLRKLAWGEARSDRRRAHREEVFHRTEPSVAELDPLVTYGVDPARLRATVESLPEPFRSTVEQRFIEGLSCAEIARAAGVPAGTVRWRQSRALEMLRAELEPPARRTRRGLLWLPLLGVERAAAVGRRVVSAPGRRGALALVGAVLVLVVATLGADGPPLDPASPAARPVPASSTTARQGAGAFGVPTLAPASQSMFVSLVPGDLDEEELIGFGAIGDEDEPATRTSRSGGQGAPGGAPRDLYDCAEVDGELRCERQPVVADQPGGPVCVILERSLHALDRGLSRAPRARSLHGETFLRAARLADLLLAAELGCALAAEPDEEEKKSERGGGGDVARREASPEIAEPTCRSEDDASGRTCTTCTDEHGAETTVCAPVDCEAATRTDGTPCTTCTDADGVVESDCEVPPPTGCDQVLGGLDVFTLEILPILAGDVDLNRPEEEALTGCVRGPCHGQPRPGGFEIDLDGAPEGNLARFACFVDLARPEASQILVCPTGDERCRVLPHPGGDWGGPGDLNYERVLAFIRAAGP